MVLSVLIAAGTWKDVRKRPEKNNIRITGSARKRIVSDLIEWSASVEAKAAERTAAYIALKSGTGKLVYADMGIININAANSTETSTEGNNDTTSRDKDIITIVHASYEVN